MTLKFLSMCSGCGGIDLGLEKAGMKCVGQVDVMNFALRILKRHWPYVPKHTDISTLLRSDSLVRIFRTPIQKAKVLVAKKVLSSLNVCESLTYLIRNGLSSKTSPDSFRLTKEGTLESSCKRWPKAGMGINGEFLTVNTSESPRDVKESSLLDILEVNVHPRYYFSLKAVQGMIRRTLNHHPKASVLMHVQDTDKTHQLKHISVQHLRDALDYTISKTTPSLQKQSGQVTGVITDSCGRKIILRNLTPTEKEKLQGFPKDWTLPVGRLSETPSLFQ